MSAELLKSVLAGAIAGLASGFLGVSPGGILVPVMTLLLPWSQHVIQGMSLIVQSPPASLSGFSIYSRKGRRVSGKAVLWVSAGFIAGGPIGAYLARACTDRALRWMFVGYLLVLAVLVIVKKPKTGDAMESPVFGSQNEWLLLIFVGVVAGLTSGLLGIGGGLAITALSVALLRKSQHEAQALTLAITMLPLTLPAAGVYIRQGYRLPWEQIVVMILGLAFGTAIGAVFANRMSEGKLKVAFVVLVFALAGYMAAVANHA